MKPKEYVILPKSNNDKEADLGLGSYIPEGSHRIINKDGSFNVVRKGLSYFETFSVYQWLITMSWLKFGTLIFSSYLLINIFFAFLYYIGGESNFEGIEASTEFHKFLNEFFFSTQTFTTVGYGRINPVGIYSNTISSIESLIGLLSLAVATGLLMGRFVKPAAKIIYSENALIAPYKDITGLQFRIANKRADHQMVDVEADLLISHINDGKVKFDKLTLEYDKITFFTTTWTINHPVTEESPLYGKTEKDLKDSNAEFFILIKGFDDTFAQIVHSRSSYKYNEIIWGAKFVSIYAAPEDGKTIIDLEKISSFTKAELPESKILSAEN
ncbi:MAG: ion channel [Ignavibacteria bacterium]